LSWIHGFEKSALEKLSGVRLEVEEVEYEGSKECRKDEEYKPEPVLEAKYPRNCASEAGGDELDVVYRVVIEQDMRAKESLLLVVRSRGG
jgi:glutamate formiminotransferase